MLTLNLSVHGVFDLFHQSARGELGLKIRATYTLGHLEGCGCKSSHSMICISMPVTHGDSPAKHKVEDRLEMMSP